MIEVVDVPPDTSEGVAREMLNRPCAENRYLLVQVLLMPNGAQRAIYRLLARVYKNPGERHGANRDGMNDTARDLIRLNSKMTVRQLVALLTNHGIKRGRTWVCDARIAIRGKGADA